MVELAGVDINALIDCYHKLIEKEREILESSGWRFDASTRLDSGTVYNICGSWTMVSELLRRKLLIEYPDGTFRTMHFDLIYRLVNVRVTMGGAPVPLEFRVVLKKEELPDFNEKSFDELSYELPGELLEALRLCGIKSLSRFQFEYIDAMMRDLIGSSDNYDAYVISSPTASGKTLIFFIPALVLALKGQRSILMYPRKALATDQLRFFLKVISRLNEILGGDVITIGIEDGDTEWERYLGEKVGKDFRSLKCPECDDGVLVYDKGGKLLMVYGSYGEEGGRFIYPTDVAFDRQGRFYVSEYGGNDRISVFDRKGHFLRSFGRPGSGRGEFLRPSAIRVHPTENTLYIADSCNHRICVYTLNGEPLFSFGGRGKELGRLSYPYDIAFTEDGRVVVCEYGNNRVQVFDERGNPLYVLGRPGRARGELVCPWGVEVAASSRLYVVDSGNNRIQVWKLK